MTEKDALNMGHCRFGIISSLLSESHLSLKERVEELASREWTLPCGRVRSYAAATIEDWYYDYRKLGFSALLNPPRSDKNRQRSIPEQVAAEVDRLFKEHKGIKNINVIRQLDDTGEKIHSRPAPKTIEALGKNWMVESTKSKLILHQNEISPLIFPLSNCLGDIVESHGHIILNDRQGPLRVVVKGTNKVIQEIIPEPESEFCHYAISDSGLLTYTQHYFERPTLTYVHQRLLAEDEDLKLTIIGHSGEYQLINDGAQIMFATCCVYDATARSTAQFA